MTLYVFNVLDLNKKIEPVNQLVVYLDNHITATEKFNLYAIGIFFIEVCYNLTESKKCSDINNYWF